VCAADILGRTVTAPAQFGAGLMTALTGTPYFLYLLVTDVALTTGEHHRRV